MADLEQAQTVTSSLILHNIHCPSCVSQIEDTLTHIYTNRSSISSDQTLLSPQVPGLAVSISSINVSILNRSVTFAHPAWLHLHDVERVLEAAGFDVGSSNEESVFKRSLSKVWHSQKHQMREAKLQTHREACQACQADVARLARSITPMPSVVVGSSDHAKGWEQATLVISGMTCSSCVGTVQRTFSLHSAVATSSVTLLPPIAKVIYDSTETSAQALAELVSDAGYEVEVVKAESLPASARTMIDAPIRYVASFAVEGMTCAACTNAVSDAIKSITPGSNSSYTVDLLGGSAAVNLLDVDMAPKIAEAIEDRGFECRLLSVTARSHGQSNDGASSTQRTVRIRVDGMYCSACLNKVNNALSSLHPFVTSFTAVHSIENPTSSVTYSPFPPDLTLRTIRDAIADVGGFQVSLVKDVSAATQAQKSQHAERRQTLYRLLVSAVFAIPMLVIGVVGMTLLPMDSSLRSRLERRVIGNSSLGNWIMLGLATPVQFGVGATFYSRSWKSLRGVWRAGHGDRSNRSRIWWNRLFRFGSMDTLVALGTTISYLASIAWLAISVNTSDESLTTYFDVSVFLIFFILCGRYLENWSKGRTSDALKALAQTKSNVGYLYTKSDDSMQTSTGAIPIDADLLEVGDLILVPSGSSPACDAKVWDQKVTSAFDESALTGEARPVTKAPGDSIFAGTTNVGSSPCIAVATSVASATTIDDVLSVARDASGKKASIEKLADMITGYFVPVIVYLSLAVFVVWASLGASGKLPNDWLVLKTSGGWTLFALQFAVAVLVTACPCGIGLAAPTAQMVGIGLAAQLGILPRGGGEAFETYQRIDRIVLDKTGTLTTGLFTVANDLNLLQSSGTTQQMESRYALLLAVISSIEQTSSHPLALGARQWCEKHLSAGCGSPFAVNLLSTEETSGSGIKAQVQINTLKIEVVIGNLTLVSGPLTDEVDKTVTDWQMAAKSVIFTSARISNITSSEERPAAESTAAILGLTYDYALLSVLALFDAPRPEAKEAIAKLSKLGIETYMASGDNLATAKSVASLVGIPPENVLGDAKPIDKKRFIEKLQFAEADGQRERKLVAFCGDGINDAPALATANVGIAIGSGTDVAKNSADFCLLNDSLISLVTLHALSKATMGRIKLNFGWAVIYNAILLPLAAGCFYPLGRTRLPPVWASLAMALSSVSVVLSSLALRATFRPPR